VRPPQLGLHPHGHVRTALAVPGFRRLFGVRLSGQFADGVFQASLAGAVLFNPERAASATDVAAGFAVLLLPYSLIGPFAGVLLDRWWRQRVLVVANLVRGLGVIGVATEIALGLHGQPFYASALVVLSISRFFNAALSAGLPHVVGRDELVTANALSTTLGAVATSAGGAAAIGARALGSGSNAGYALTALAAVVPYLFSAAVARGFERTVLGPDAVERARRETLGDVARGLVAGARYVHHRRPAFLALAMIGVHRLCYGLWAVSTVLLFRNYYVPDGVFRAGLAGLAQFVTATAIGGGFAALLTPTLSRRIGLVPWVATLLSLAGLVELGCGLVFRLPYHLLGGLLLAFCAQAIKISVDTQLQRHVTDEYRGRVFALYDTVFNLALVVAATLTALVIPDSGRSPVAVLVIGMAYLATGAAYLHAGTRRSALMPAVAQPTG
jgi:MFS family permease